VILPFSKPEANGSLIGLTSRVTFYSQLHRFQPCRRLPRIRVAAMPATKYSSAPKVSAAAWLMIAPWITDRKMPLPVFDALG
jgi:hypothetical protein